MQRRSKIVGQHFAWTAVWVIFLCRCSLDLARADGPPAFPEGSVSIIQTRTWYIVGSDPTVLRGLAKAAVEKIGEAVLVKEAEGLLVVSLPTRNLAGLRQALDKLGRMQTARKEAASAVPTTLLRITFSQPSAAP